MKKSLVFIPFLLCLLISCQDKQAMAELDELKAKAELEEQNKAFVEKAIEELNNKNIQVLLDEYCDPQYSFYSPSNTPNPLSREDMKGFLESLFIAFPDINWSIKEIFAEGDRVIVWNVVSGTHENEFQGIPASGNKVEVSSILIYKIQNGKTLEEREEADLLGLMNQMSMELN